MESSIAVVTHFMRMMRNLIRRKPVAQQPTAADLRKELTQTKKLLAWHAVRLAQARRATEDVMWLREASLDEGCVAPLRLNLSAPLPPFCLVSGASDGAVMLHVQGEHAVLTLRVYADSDAPTLSPDELAAQIGYRMHAVLLDQFYNECGPGDEHV